MAKAEVVRARIDAEVKKEATRVLGEMGLTPSDGIRMFMTTVARKKELPFHPMDYFEPNAETLEAMAELEQGQAHTSSTVEELMAELRAPD